MTERDAYLNALSILINSAPDDLDIAVIVGDRTSGDFMVFHNCCDECSSRLIEVARDIDTGVIVPDRKDIVKLKETLQ